MKLHVYDAAKATGSPVAMTAGAQGVWTRSGPATWYGQYYRYELDLFHPMSGRIETWWSPTPTP